MVALYQVRCRRSGCPRRIHLCYPCAWGPIACSKECLVASQAESRAVSRQRYWRSERGKRTTARRVREWRAHRVTHTSARKVGPSPIVVPLGSAPTAMAASAAAVSSEGTSHDDNQSGQSVRTTLLDPDGIVADDQGSHRAP